MPDCDLVDVSNTAKADQERAYGLGTMSVYLPVDATRSAQLARFLVEVGSEANGELKADYEMDIIDEASLEGGPYAWLALSGKL